MRNQFLLIGLLWGISHLSAQTLLPSAEYLQREQGIFRLDNKTPVVYSEDAKAFYLQLFQSEVINGYKIHFSTKREKADICFITDASLDKDAYKIKITPKQMEVRANSKGGFIYAVQTLRQWVSREDGKPVFACVQIADRPRTQWRSFLLDSGRQYQKVATIKKYIDMVSLLKMNYFHWHLTEGLGWRIEIKKYPLLTKVGAFVGKGAEQQGYYSQKEIREIVKYASDRNITIVPEIDMPGHAEAALSAYPELGCLGTPVRIPEIGFTENIFCAGKDHTIRFLKDVIDEVCDLFPSTYIHLGGDEAPKKNWDQCSNCQNRIKTEGLKDSHDLQLWLSAQMADYLKTKGRNAIFWGDVVYQDGYPLPDNVSVHWWNYRGHKDLAFKNAIKHNYSVICGTNTYTYLNFPLTPWKGYKKERTFDLRDVYLHNPSYLPREMNPLVLGMSCALWTDDGVTEAMIDQRLFPRILAIAEQMWYCGQQHRFDAFHQIVKEKKDWFGELGFHYGPALREEVDMNYKWD